MRIKPIISNPLTITAYLEVDNKNKFHIKLEKEHRAHSENQTH